MIFVAFFFLQDHVHELISICVYGLYHKNLIIIVFEVSQQLILSKLLLVENLLQVLYWLENVLAMWLLRVLPDATDLLVLVEVVYLWVYLRLLADELDGLLLANLLRVERVKQLNLVVLINEVVLILFVYLVIVIGHAEQDVLNLNWIANS